MRAGPGSERSTPGSAVDPHGLERFALPLCIVFALAVAGVYLPTLYPSVAGGDSGELIVAAHRLGVAHPPGYPLFTLLGKLFTLLPAGSVAWRVNLVTALLAAAAAGVLLRAAWKAAGSLAAGLFAGGLFAFSPLVWRYAVQAEVFSLNNLFAAILLLLLVSFEAGRRDATVRWFCFWFGLGLTNHHTLLFVAVPIGLRMLLAAPRAALRWPRVLALPGCAALGLVPYLYLLVSPADHPGTTWGDTGSVSGFLDHLLRKQYGTFRLGTMAEGGSLPDRLWGWVVQLPVELLWIGPLLALLAVALAATRRGRAGGVPAGTVAVASAALALYLVAFGSLTRISLEDPFWYEIHARFWQQANLVVCLLAGVGLAWVLRRTGLRSGIAALALATAAGGLQAGIHYGDQDHGSDRLVADFARTLLERVPQGALLVTRGDLYWNSIRYLQHCEGLRPDVRILDVELLEAPWMTARVERSLADVALPGEVYRAPSRATGASYDLADLFDANAGRVALLSNALEDGDESWKAGYEAWPEGLLDRVVPAGDPVDVDRWLARTQRWIEGTDPELPVAIPEGSWERLARDHLLRVESRRGTRLLMEAVRRPLDDTYVRRAGEILERAAARRDEPSPALHFNLGIAHYLLRDSDPGAVDRMVSAWSRFLETGDPDDPRRELVRRVLADPRNARVPIGVR